MDEQHHHPENDPAYKGLKVQHGVESAPPIINPHFRRRRLPELSAEQYIKEIVAGNITRLSQAVTLVESTLEAHRERLKPSLRDVFPMPEGAFASGSQVYPGPEKVPV